MFTPPPLGAFPGQSLGQVYVSLTENLRGSPLSLPLPLGTYPAGQSLG
jgi:hypothetical protein